MTNIQNNIGWLNNFSVMQTIFNAEKIKKKLHWRNSFVIVANLKLHENFNWQIYLSNVDPGLFKLVKYVGLIKIEELHWEETVVNY